MTKRKVYVSRTENRKNETWVLDKGNWSRANKGHIQVRKKKVESFKNHLI